MEQFKVANHMVRDQKLIQALMFRGLFRKGSVYFLKTKLVLRRRSHRGTNFIQVVKKMIFPLLLLCYANQLQLPTVISIIVIN